MLRKIPTTAVPLSISEILKGFKSFFGRKSYIGSLNTNLQGTWDQTMPFHLTVVLPLYIISKGA